MVFVFFKLELTAQEDSRINKNDTYTTTVNQLNDKEKVAAFDYNVFSKIPLKKGKTYTAIVKAESRENKLFLNITKILETENATPHTEPLSESIVDDLPF